MLLEIVYVYHNTFYLEKFVRFTKVTFLLYLGLMTLSDLDKFFSTFDLLLSCRDLTQSFLFLNYPSPSGAIGMM